MLPAVHSFDNFLNLLHLSLIGPTRRELVGFAVRVDIFNASIKTFPIFIGIPQIRSQFSTLAPHYEFHCETLESANSGATYVASFEGSVER